MSNDRFAKEFLVQYGCVTDHDAYEHLRVSIEVDKAFPETRGIVHLNGRPIGIVEYIDKKQFRAVRYQNTKEVELGVYKKLGLATAKIITDLLPA
jgi:hypothetical protein